MSINKRKELVKSDKSIFLSALFAIFNLFLLAALSIALSKPAGSLSGKIALEQKGFQLYSYDIRQNKVYAIAQGPRGIDSMERGVWVKPDGTFRIDQLPIGEYTLKVHCQGYASCHQSGLFVKDGKCTLFPQTITMNVLEPSVSVASNTRVFTTKESPHFWINASGGIHATIKLYRKDFFSALKSYHDANVTDADLSSELQFYGAPSKLIDSLDKESTIQTLQRELSLDDQDSARADFKLKSPLPAGDYFVVAELANVDGKVDRQLTWFSVSDIGLVVKHAPDSTFVRAVDFNTLKPRSGVKVNLYLLKQTETGQSLAQGITDSQGICILKSPYSTDTKNLLAVGTLDDNHAYGASWYYTNRPDNYQMYFYTDRPVYRLGQTVCFKSIIRMTGPHGFSTPKTGLKINCFAKDPDSNDLWQANLNTNDHGTISGTIPIPEDGKTGFYQVIFQYPDGTNSYQSFEILQYRKPEYQVEVNTIQPRVVAGSKIKAHIHATYYFGGPVANARVKYSVYNSTDWSIRYHLLPRPSYYSYFDDWGEDSDIGYFDSTSGGYVTQGYTQTDQNGDADIEFNSLPIVPDLTHPTGSQYLDQRYKIEAEVTDLSRMSVIASGNCSVTAGNFALFVNPQSSVYKSGSPLSVDFNTIDYDGKPVANQKVTIRLVRWPWNSVEQNYRPKEIVKEFTETTDFKGQGRLSFKIGGALPSDTYYVTAESVDAAGHLVYDERSIWIANQSTPYVLSSRDAHQEPLVVKLNKTIFQPGETVKAMISGPFTGKEGAEAIVSMEGAGLYDYKIIPLTATAQLVELPIKASYEPNAYITVAVVGPNRQFLTQSKMIKVSPSEHFLAINVESDKSKYKPGESVQYTIHTNYADGRPAPNTELSLSVVDEGIYAIRPESAEDIQKAFYSRSPNNVTTVCSFPEQYSGGPDKVEPKVRKDFRDTAAWLPNLVTNKDGIAIASIKLPDNLTTWRATVRGINTAVDVGSATDKIICTQDLILRLALPRFFTEGDEGIVSAIVHNYTDKSQTVKVSLTKPDQLQIASPLSCSIPIAPDKAERVQWPVKIISSGQAKILCKAVGDTAGDAIEKQIPIRCLGLPAFSVKCGVLRNNPDLVVLPVGLVQDAAPETAKYKLSLAASSIGPVLGNFGSLIDYPYGCTEQTMSRLMPSVVAIRLNQALKVPLAPDMSNLFQKVYNKSMKKLDEYQQTDGGWGWWQYDHSNIYLTAYVLEGYSLLKQCGYQIQADRQKSALKWLAKAVPDLQKQLSDSSIMHDHFSNLEAYIDIAKAIHTLSLYGKSPPEAVKLFLSSKIGELTPEALSYLTLAYNHLNDRTASEPCYRRLIQLANSNDNLLDWDHRESLLKKLGGKNFTKDWLKHSDYTYRFTGTETTALALRAVVAMEPDNFERIEAIKNWLLLQRNKNGWDNTKTTAQVFIALLEEELKTRSKNPADFTLTAKLASSTATDFAFNQSNIYAPEKDLSYPLPLTPNNLELKKSGPGRLYYTSLTTYMQHLKPGDHVAEKSMPNGIHLTRQFFRLEPDAVSQDGNIHFKTNQITDHTVHEGETVLMKVTVDAPIALPYVIVEAALPSGAEVVENDPRKNMVEDTSGDNSGISGDWGDWWWTHEDTLDDRLVFFTTKLPPGKHEFWAMLRLEMPGTFQMNPLSLEGMYTKKIRAYSALDSLRVLE